MWYLLKNRPTVKKVAALLKMASVKKVVKLKGTAKKYLWWYRLMAKILIKVNFVLIYSEAGMRQWPFLIGLHLFTVGLFLSR